MAKAAVPVTVPGGSRVVVVVSTGPLDEPLNEAADCETLVMPAVLGKSQGAALEALSRLHLRPRVIYDYNETIRKGCVMAQHPAEGAPVSPDLESLLLVSSGAAINERMSVNLPSVIGLEEEAAAKQLRAGGLLPQFVHEKSATVPAGQVSAQIPDRASLAVKPETKGRLVWLIIAVIIAALALLAVPLVQRGIHPPEQAVAQVTVPDVVGLKKTEAIAELEKAGLTIGEVTTVKAEEVPDSATQGEVLLATPEAGQKVAEGSPVTLKIVSENAEEYARITVPNLSKLSEKAARKKLEKAGLTMVAVTGPSLDTKTGKVALQSPEPGVQMGLAETVTVVLSSGKPANKKLLDLPNLVGKPIAEATTALQKLGLVVTVNPDQAAGPVLTQTPASGTKVPEGAVIILLADTQ